mgnify:CR=1 FL=1
MELDFYEFPITFTSILNPDINNKNKKEGDYYLKHKILVTEDGQNNHSYYLTKYFQKVDSTKSVQSSLNWSFKNPEGFNGMIHLVNKDEQLIFAKRVENSSTIDSKSFFEKKEKGSSLTRRVDESCTTVTTYHYKDWYNVRPGGFRKVKYRISR